MHALRATRGVTLAVIAVGLLMGLLALFPGQARAEAHGPAPTALLSAIHPDTVDCPTDGHTNNPQVNIWVHVDKKSGTPTIRAHAHIHCDTVPNSIHGKVHFQRMIFPPGEPTQPGHWKEIAATRVYSGLNAHMQLIVPMHHIRWRPGRFRAAFEVWGFSHGQPPGGNRYGSGYWCTSNLDIPKGPPPGSSFRLTIHPDTHLCDPPQGHVITTAHRTSVPNHQFCLTAGRHLCMATAHAGINSQIVLRVNGHTRAQAITWHTGRLVINGHPGQCVGTTPDSLKARSAHCNGGHGIRWRLIVFPGRGIGFDNVAADRANPGPQQFFLTAGFDEPGQPLFVVHNLHLPHIWRDCAGNCTTPRTATLTRARTHTQLCLDAGRHMCLYVLHRGLNSRVILRPDRDVRAEDISYSYGQLIVYGYPGVCIGPNARTKHCSTPGTGWQGVTTVQGAAKFWNAQDTVRDPRHRAHWLTASGVDSGFRVIVSADWRLLHKWRICTGHCATPAASGRELSTTAVRVSRTDRIFGCAVQVKMREPVISGSSKRQPYTKIGCTNRPRSFSAHLSMRKKINGRWVKVWTGHTSTKNPWPFHYYWKDLACAEGTYQAQFTASGTDHNGVVLSSPVTFRSRPLTIRDCVAANAVTPLTN